MKNPKTPMSNNEFSYLVVRFCVVLACIAMIVVICTSGKPLTWQFEIPCILGMGLVAIIGIFSFVFDIMRAKGKDDDEE